MTPTIQCPTCSQPHAVFYFVRGNGRKELMYCCDKQEFMRKVNTSRGYRGEIHFKTMNLPVPYSFLDMVDPYQVFPEKWSASYTKSQALKKQNQLALMYEKR
jgi:hypothetical protein